MKYIPVIFFLILVPFFSFNNDFFYSYFKGGEFLYVTNEVASSEYTTCGDKYFNYFKNINNIQEKEILYKEVTTNLDKKRVLKDLNIDIKREEIYENFNVIYGFTPYFNEFVVVGNSKINIQIVIGFNNLKIGVPIIYSGF